MPKEGQSEAKIEAKHLGNLGQWAFDQLTITREEEPTEVRWVARFTRPEKAINQPSKHRKKKARLIFRRTEAVVSSAGTNVFAYSFLITQKIVGTTVGDRRDPPDPIPLDVIRKLAELKSEYKGGIVLSGQSSGRIIIPGLIPPKDLRKGKKS